MPDWTYSGTSVDLVDSDSNGNAYFVDGDTLISYDSTGTERWSTVMADTNAVAIYASDANSIVYVGHDDPSSSFQEIEGFNYSDGSLFSADDALQVTDISYDDTNGGKVVAGGGSSNEIVTNSGTGNQFTHPDGTAFESVSVVGSEVYAGDVNGEIFELDIDTMSQNNRTDFYPTNDNTILDITSINNEAFFVADSEVTNYDNGTATLDWQEPATNPTSIGLSGGEVYVGGSETDARLAEHHRSDGTLLAELVDSTYSTFTDTAGVGGSTEILVTTGTDVVQYQQSEFNSLFDSVTATQPSSTATMNDAGATTQVLAYATMNTASVSSYDTSASQINSLATVNDSFISTTIISSSQVGGAATINTVDSLDETITTTSTPLATANSLESSVEYSETTVFIETEQGLEYAVNGILYDGTHPFLQEGSTTELTLILDKENYNDIRNKHGRYLTEESIKTHTSFYNKPTYRQVIHPESSVISYLWKFEPLDSVTAVGTWWVVVMDINDSTKHYGDGEQLDVELLPLKEYEGETFTEISEEYEV